MKRSLLQISKLRVIALVVVLSLITPASFAQQDNKPHKKSAIAPVHHKKKRRKHKGHVSKHTEIKHGSDNDKKLEEIKAEKDKNK